MRGEAGVFTPARPGTSKHEKGLAVDIARPDLYPGDDPVLAWLGGVWRSMGGRWPGASDPVHFEYPA